MRVGLVLRKMGPTERVVLMLLVGEMRQVARRRTMPRVVRRVFEQVPETGQVMMRHYVLLVQDKMQKDHHWSFCFRIITRHSL